MEKYLRAYAEVDLDAIGHNIAEVRRNVGDEVKICAVIKADAYGHGAVAVGRYLESAVEYFAVATVDEAIELREAGIRLPIIILSYVSPSRYDEVVKYDVTQTVYSLETARLLSEAAKAQGRIAKAVGSLVAVTGLTGNFACAFTVVACAAAVSVAHLTSLAYYTLIAAAVTSLCIHG